MLKWFVAASLTDLPGVTGSECRVPVSRVARSLDVVFQGHECVQLLVVQTGTVGSVPVPPEEPEAGRIGRLDSHRAGRQLLKTGLNLLCCSCREPQLV